MSVSRRVTIPEALDLTSTFVMGWTLPVATTERAMSPSSALPSWEGSNLVVFPRAVTAMPRAATTTRTMRPVQSQNFRLRLRCVAKGCSHIFLVSEVSRSVVTQEDAARFHRRGRKLLQGRRVTGGSYFGRAQGGKEFLLWGVLCTDFLWTLRGGLCVFTQDAENFPLDA